jgi:hypothetical protein
MNLFTPEIVTPLELFTEQIMISTPLLEAKYKAQKQLDEEAQNLVERYIQKNT